jgi:hypothetical protein
LFGLFGLFGLVCLVIYHKFLSFNNAAPCNFT